MDSADTKAAVDQTNSEPLCHQHAESPSKDSPVPSHAPSHDGASPCNQGQVIESKLSVGGKVTLPLVAILPHAVQNLTERRPRIIGFSLGEPRDAADPPILFSVLRI